MKGFDRLKVSMAAALCSVAIGNPGYAADDALAPPEPPKLQGYTVVRPMQDSSESAVSRAVAAGATIPNWRYSVTPRLDGQRYTGRIVGTNPFQRGAGTSTIPTQLIPLIIKIADANGTVTYDPTKADPACAGGVPATLAAQSPVFANHPFVFGSANVGNTQYVDAFQRANFWKQVSTISPNYHTRLALKTLKPITVTVPAGGSGFNFNRGGCAKVGVFDINWFDALVQNTLIPAVAAQGVNARTFPNFLLYNVVMSDGPLNQQGTNCCILGYHSAYNRGGTQTYSISDYDSSEVFSNTADVSVLTHEVAEWINDPIPTFTDNLTPAWGNVGQVQNGCQDNYEVGDPLSGSLLPAVKMPNGFSYHLQELAFFSWFYRQRAPFTTGGKPWHSNNGTFKANAGAVCF